MPAGSSKFYQGPALGQAADQQIESLRESGEVRGKPSELTLLHEPKGLQSRRLMLMGHPHLRSGRHRTSLADSGRCKP